MFALRAATRREAPKTQTKQAAARPAPPKRQSGSATPDPELGAYERHIGGKLNLREDLSTGHGLRFSTEVYGSKWEKMVFHEYLQKACVVLTDISESLRKPP